MPFQGTSAIFFHFLRYGQNNLLAKSARHSAICRGRPGKHNCILECHCRFGDPITPVQLRKARVRHSHRTSQQSSWNSEQPTWKFIKFPNSPARSIPPQQKMPIYIYSHSTLMHNRVRQWLEITTMQRNKFHKIPLSTKYSDLCALDKEFVFRQGFLGTWKEMLLPSLVVYRPSLTTSKFNLACLLVVN